MNDFWCSLDYSGVKSGFRKCIVNWHGVFHAFPCAQVAQHLASTYGAKAFEVAKMAQVTGQRWPIVGKRLVSEFPYIESEVKRRLFLRSSQYLPCSVSSFKRVLLLRCCTPLRSTPAPPSTSSPGERAWASWTCRRPTKRFRASSRLWGRSWTGVRRRGRYDLTVELKVFTCDFIHSLWRNLPGDPSDSRSRGG